MDEARQTFDFLERNTGIIRSLGISNFSVGRNSRVMTHPEEYGVVLPAAGNDLDFKLYIPYQTSQGLTDEQGWQLTEDCYAKVAVKLEGDVLLEKIGHHYDKGCILPQYLSHYEATDPTLHSIVKAKKADPKPHRTITLKMKPRLKPNISEHILKFNIRQIRQNIAECAEKISYPEPTFTLFDPDICRFKRIIEEASEILALCDGRRTISDIAKTMAMRFAVPTTVVEKDCVALLQPIFDEGYLLLAA